MISNVGVLTAGHVVYSPEYGWPYKAEIILGGFNSNEKTVIAESFATVNGWIDYQGYEYDYGVVQIPLNIAYYGTQYYGDKSSLLGKTVNRYGFPSDKDGDNIWRASGKIDMVNDNRFTYTNGYASDGESGSPVIMANTGSIVGIHSGSAVASNIKYGVAVRMRKDILDFIVKYGGATKI